MSKEVKRYLKDIKILFPVFQKEEKEYYNRIKDSITKQSQGKNIVYEDLVNIYGTPNDIVNSYIEEMESIKLIRKVRKQRFIKKTIITVCGIVTICILAFLIWRTIQINQMREDFHTAIPIESEEIIEEIN